MDTPYSLSIWDYAPYTPKAFERIYGSELNAELEQEYLKPHKANDMWAVGIVLKKMNKAFGPKVSAKINRVTQGLLSDSREQRLTVKEALTAVSTNFRNSQLLADSRIESFHRRFRWASAIVSFGNLC